MAFYIVFCCISMRVVCELAFIVLTLINVVFLADVRIIAKYINSDERAVHFLMC